MSVLLDLEDVSVSLDKRRVIDGVSLKAGAGEFIGLIGPNGAGKSTLLKAAAGLIPVEKGERRIVGQSIDSLPPTERARRLAYLPQARPVFWAMPAREIVALGRFAYGGSSILQGKDKEAVGRAMNDAGAAHLANRTAASLSGGELARIHLARTLAAETPVLLADEPVAALDPAHQLSVMALLRAKADAGTTIIAALHELSLAARYCTRLVILDKGRIAADGAPGNILTPDLLRDVFGVSAHVELINGAPDLRLAPLA